MTTRYFPYPSYMPGTLHDPIPKQTEGTYQDYKKIKGFEDVGHFLNNYVVSGGIVTKNVKRNDCIDVSDIIVVLQGDVQKRDGTSFLTEKPNITYYLDFKDGDFTWGLEHPSGVLGIDWLPIAEVTTNVYGNVATITDKAEPRGGFRLKSEYGMFGYLRQIVNVLDFGATGDGVTDDAPAIQAALDYSEGKTVVFPAGTYKLGSVVIPKNNTTVLSMGATITNEGFDVSDKFRIVIDGFIFDENENSWKFLRAIRSNGKSKDIEIINNTFRAAIIQLSSTEANSPNENIRIVKNNFVGNVSLKGAYHDIIQLTNTVNSLIANNYFEMYGVYRYIKLLATAPKKSNDPNYTYYVVEDGYCRNIIIEGNVIVGTMADHLSVGLTKQVIDLFNGAENIDIVNNVIEVNTNSGDPQLEAVIEGKSFGADPNNTYTNKCRNINVINNKIKGNFQKALGFGNLYGQNKVLDSTGNVYDNQSSKINITGNEIICTNITTSVLSLIYVYGHRVVNIENNKILMDRSKSETSKSIEVRSCGYIMIKNNELLQQAKIHILDNLSLDGVLNAFTRNLCIFSIEIIGNVIEYSGNRAIQFYQISSTEPVENSKVSLKVLNNHFYNNEPTYNSMFNTAGRFRSIVVQNNTLITDSGSISFPNYSGMSARPIVDEGNTWSLYYTNPPTSNTWNTGQKILNALPTPGGYTGWVCVAGGTPGTWKGFGQIQS